MCEFVIFLRIERNGTKWTVIWPDACNKMPKNLTFNLTSYKKALETSSTTSCMWCENGQGTRVSRKIRQRWLRKKYNIPFPLSLLKNDKCDVLFFVEPLFPADGILNHYNSSWWSAFGSPFSMWKYLHCIPHYASISVHYIYFIIKWYFYLCV